MKYHAKVQYGGANHHWWNFEKESLIRELIIPFVNGQVVVINKAKHKHILNMKNVSLVTVFKTSKPLHRAPDGGSPIELRSADFDDNECTEEILKEAIQVDAPH